MLLLAVDTSGKSLSLAICENEQLVAEMTLHQGYNHSITQMPLLQDMLRHSGLKISEIDIFACSVGPGSFTGIRIGISSVKAMAYAAGKPAVGVSSLQALVYPLRNLDNYILCPVIDARRGRVFAAAWLGGNDINQNNYLIAEKNWLAADFIEELGKFSKDGRQVIFAGDGQESLRQTHIQKNGEDEFKGVMWGGHDFLNISAASVARIAYEKWQKGSDYLPQNLMPNYLSPSQAERMKSMADVQK